MVAAAADKNTKKNIHVLSLAVPPRELEAGNAMVRLSLFLSLFRSQLTSGSGAPSGGWAGQVRVEPGIHMQLHRTRRDATAQVLISSLFCARLPPRSTPLGLDR